MVSGIYLIRNVVDGKLYIGSAVDINRRWRRHRFDLNHGKHHNIHLQRAWSEDGENSFEFSIIEVCAPEVLIIREQAWIDYHDVTNHEKGYNLAKNAGSTLGVGIGRKHTDETKQKMSNAHRGHTVSDETRRKIGDATRGKSPSEKRRKEISVFMKGRHIGKEFKNGTAPWNKGKPWSEEMKKKLSDAHKKK